MPLAGYTMYPECNGVVVTHGDENLKCFGSIHSESLFFLCIVSCFFAVSNCFELTAGRNPLKFQEDTVHTCVLSLSEFRGKPLRFAPVMVSRVE
jgi:uncharacterized UBP type Zn finger protein